MLGCQDFCGYYEWTFHYLRRKYGTPAVEKFWSEAIAKDSQSHYIAAGQQELLRGLYEAWSHTGESEQCDWTVSIDESRNHLRMDMRKCPSKGFLIKNDLNADEDYCDHCIGWIGPALNIIGAEVVAHEHNHCGQCWWRIRMTSAPSKEPALPDDIRHDPHWQAGFIDRFECNERVTAGDTLAQKFINNQQLLVIGDAGLPTEKSRAIAVLPNSIITDSAYLAFESELPQPRCILLGSQPDTLRKIAERWSKIPEEKRPWLAHAFFPTEDPVPFLEIGLPRPLPLLPALIRKGLYVHRPGQTRPSMNNLAVLLAAALATKILVTGIDSGEFDAIVRKHDTLHNLIANRLESEDSATTVEFI